MEPFKINVDRARREAKALLEAARRGEPEALSQLRPDRAPRLADAQFAVANGYGFRSWPELVKAECDLGGQLRAAALAGDDDRLYALLDAGTPPNATDPRTGRTALHVAAAADQLDTVSVLVGWVPVDKLARDRSNRTALDLARPTSAVAAVLESCGLGAARPRLASRYAQLADEADVALLEHFSHSTGVVRHDLGDGFILRTGLEDNSKNGVVCSQLPGHADISRVLATLADVPARWYLSSVTEPSDLRARLEREGCRGERTAAHMAAELDGIDSGVSPDVVEVHDADDLVHVDSGEARLLVAAGPPYVISRSVAPLA